MEGAFFSIFCLCKLERKMTPNFWMTGTLKIGMIRNNCKYINKWINKQYINYTYKTASLSQGDNNNDNHYFAIVFSCNTLTWLQQFTLLHHGWHVFFTGATSKAGLYHLLAECTKTKTAAAAAPMALLMLFCGQWLAAGSISHPALP